MRTMVFFAVAKINRVSGRPSIHNKRVYVWSQLKKREC